MDILEKERQLNGYIKEWIAARYESWKEFSDDIEANRRTGTGIYMLKDGDHILDLLIDIMGNIEEYYLVDEDQNLIPTKFSSIYQFLLTVSLQNEHFRSRRFLLERNLCGDDTSDIVFGMFRIIEDFNQMKERCWVAYGKGDSLPIPYEKAIAALYNNDIEEFIKIMKCLVKDVPYLIHKEKVNEGYFHTLVHIIASMLGFRPISEKATSDGRMDMQLETPTHVYIMEFKYSDKNEDLSKTAFMQILDKGYYDPESLIGKPVVGIGISFSSANRNINGHHIDILYRP